MITSELTGTVIEPMAESVRKTLEYQAMLHFRVVQILDDLCWKSFFFAE